ncbi:acetate/propionate family kinase [Rhizobium sp. CB3171]|uniref:acetate/propionate family kinase n=1 Tax=unclassified Rhizobium TaxID=2613769 RepID=UPI000CDF4CD7|nr:MULTISPECIES: acetate/propionate family kinase [Rhizobium]AVA22505.1 acetate kinase 1 [Rhizobium sp. NXC24]UWU19894.1 acetate/propionate family kinase [Rhizobium tropici]WFU00717.1 acetate/propionate family kinase [Rhizobium sp. CB3171]
MTSGNLLLTFNAGSSTVKIGVFEVREDKACRVGKGQIDFRLQPLAFHLTAGRATFDRSLQTDAVEHLHEVVEETFGILGEHFDMSAINAIGHRVVHGGDMFTGPVRLDEDRIRDIEDLTVLAPLHQPQALRLIRAVKHLRPALAQTASFDTAFHATQNDLVRRFALPRTLHDQGIKRYGFHGLSYAFIAAELRRRAPQAAAGRVIVAHLGSGASLCALDKGESRDCSMGFSTLDGIPMATRCGNLDPGVLLHLLGPEGRTPKDVEDMLYHKSGLLGVSGISADTRDLLKSSKLEAREAIDLFCLRIAGEVARMAATLGGLDSLVFTAGIGEHQPEIRTDICDRLRWLGLEIDEDANAANAPIVSTSSSSITAFVIPTDEEQIIADEALSIFAGERSRS